MFDVDLLRGVPEATAIVQMWVDYGLYRRDRHSCLHWPKMQYKKPRRCLAFEMVPSIWVFHERLLLMVTLATWICLRNQQCGHQAWCWNSYAGTINCSSPAVDHLCPKEWKKNWYYNYKHENNAIGGPKNSTKASSHSLLHSSHKLAAMACCLNWLWAAANTTAIIPIRAHPRCSV